MSNIYKFIRVDGYEQVVKCENEKANFISYISVHNTLKGPSLGGCRFTTYESEEFALADVLSLSRAMTFKNCLADINYGGGKSVIIKTNTDNEETKKEKLKWMGEFVEYLKGKYIIAEDVNINCNDLDIIRKETSYVVPKISGDPSPVTAKGVYLGILKSWKYLQKQNLTNKDISETKILVYGVGAVGSELVHLLSKKVKNIHVFDINKERINSLKEKYSHIKEEINENAILYEYYDIIAPCALGGFINTKTSSLIRTKLIAGCANNQLSNEEQGKILLSRNILYAPDYVINAGGVIQITGVRNNMYVEDIVELKLKNIPKLLKKIYKKSAKYNLPTNIVADKLVMKKLFKLYNK